MEGEQQHSIVSIPNPENQNEREEDSGKKKNDTLSKKNSLIKTKHFTAQGLAGATTKPKYKIDGLYEKRMRDYKDQSIGNKFLHKKK